MGSRIPPEYCPQHPPTPYKTVLYLHCADLASTWPQSCSLSHTQESALDLKSMKTLVLLYCLRGNNKKLCPCSAQVQGSSRINQSYLPPSVLGLDLGFVHVYPSHMPRLLRISLNLRSSCLTLRSSWDVGYTSTSALSVPSSGFDLGIQNRREDKGLALPGCWGAAQWGPYAEEGPGLFPAAGTYYSPHHLAGTSLSPPSRTPQGIGSGSSFTHLDARAHTLRQGLTLHSRLA